METVMCFTLLNVLPKGMDRVVHGVIYQQQATQITTTNVPPLKSNLSCYNDRIINVKLRCFRVNHHTVHVKAARVRLLVIPPGQNKVNTAKYEHTGLS